MPAAANSGAASIKRRHQLIEAQTNQMQLSWRLTILAEGGPRLPALAR
jgi:hypothetical protein